MAVMWREQNVLGVARTAAFVASGHSPLGAQTSGSGRKTSKATRYGATTMDDPPEYGLPLRAAEMSAIALCPRTLLPAASSGGE